MRTPLFLSLSPAVDSGTYERGASSCSRLPHVLNSVGRSFVSHRNIENTKTRKEGHEPHPYASPRHLSHFLCTMAFLYADFVVSIWGKEFDLEEHEDIVRSGGVVEGHAPTVDVFLPVCNEPTVLLENTWRHVRDLDYPYFTAYVLDDGANDEVEALAAAYGFECEHHHPETSIRAWGRRMHDPQTKR